MKTARQTFRLLSTLIIGLLVCAFLADDSRAQREGGGRGRGRGGGRGSKPDLRPSRRSSPFPGLPWEAQNFLQEHMQAFRRLHPALRTYVVVTLKGWDVFFPPERERMEVFFRKVEASDAPREELRKAFKGTLPPRPPQPPRDQGQRRRQRRPQLQALSGEELARIDGAFDRYAFEDRAFGPALVVVAFSGSGTLPATPLLPTDLRSQGTLLKNLTFTGPPRNWLATFLTGCEDAIKGKNLRYPSLFEYYNYAKEDKTHTRTLALYIGDDAPPDASKSKGFGKKYCPLVVRAAKLEKAAKLIDDELGEAERSGKSVKYVEAMVKPRLTPDVLKIDKVVKEKALSRLIWTILMASEENRKLDNTFQRAVALSCLYKAQPDLFLVHLRADGAPENARFLQDVSAVLQDRIRYKDRAILAVLDQTGGQALLIGPKIQAGREISPPHTLEDLSATLSQLAGIRASQAKGSPVQEIVTR